MRVMFLFVDGVGIGPRDPALNPFAVAHLPNLRGLLGDIPFLDHPSLEGAHATVVPLDATLDVDGLPQSGTGQTTLLTGVNAPAHINEHYGPYPDERLAKLLENNIYHRVLAVGRTAAFANAYPDIFLDRIERGTDRRSAMAQAPAAAGLPYRTHRELSEGRAVSASLTNERWPHSDQPALITAHKAGRNFATLARGYDFTLFEFFLTDVAGHRPARLSAVAILERLDEFIGGIVDAMDMQDSILLVTSDHGNIEDSSTRRHTRNPVPAILVGDQRRVIAQRLQKLTDVAPAVLQAMGIET